MKTELNANASLAHRLMAWCKDIGPRKMSKFVFMYGLCVAIICTFDYAWMPFLAIKFQYLAFFPLYVSLVVVCMIGLGLYELFKEDIFLKKKLEITLNKEGKYKFTRWVKGKMNADPKTAFMIISLENPLQAYLYYRQEDRTRFSEAIRLISIGSFYCAFFWGVVIDVLVACWHLGMWIIKLYL